MPTKYWQRTRKLTVDYLRETPFALDRQLEDQKYSQELNRNPQLYQPTKVDKTRSELILAPKGASRAVAMKANAVNKFVREATGIHNYTIVPPPRAITDDDPSVKEILDPETNPRVRSYAAEAKIKPVLCSFGHRPSSASRTFHPATMKFRLPHGAIVPQVDPRRSSVGMPVAVLKKVIKAPPIVNVIEEAEKAASAHPSPTQQSPMFSRSTSPNKHGGPSVSYNDLFLSKEEQDSLFAPAKDKRGSFSSRSQMSLNSGRSQNSKLSPINSRSQSSWVSNKEEDDVVNLKEIFQPKDSRPAWDEGFHRVNLPPSHVFKLRSSAINAKEKKPLGELLHRFSSLSVAENQNHPFCTEKQELDKLQRSGVVPPVPKSVPVKYQKLYFDPLDAEVRDVQRYHQKAEEEKTAKKKVWDYKQALKTIPQVDYYPTSLVKTELPVEDPNWSTVEQDMKESLREAKKGNLEVLYETTFAKHDPEGKLRIRSVEEMYFRDMGSTGR
eukprot:scaffold681_cov173-Ochromonas_danica.AAC.9